MKPVLAIVGRPNVGKSTLFNALTKTRGAQAANYPFCTIEPNVGIVEVPDETISYDDRFYWSADNPKQLDDITVTPEEGEPYTQHGLKHQWIAQVKDTAGKLLAQTDWMVIRKAERDIAIPADVVIFGHCHVSILCSNDNHKDELRVEQ